MFGLEWSEIFSIENIWLAVGFLGQGLFAIRWLVQWFSSERQRRSVIPISFWWISMGGAISAALRLGRSAADAALAMSTAAKATPDARHGLLDTTTPRLFKANCRAE